MAYSESAVVRDEQTGDAAKVSNGELSVNLDQDTSDALNTIAESLQMIQKAQDQNEGMPLMVDAQLKKDSSGVLQVTPVDGTIYRFAPTIATSSSVGVLLLVDTTGYKYAVAQITTAAASITAQTSNDGITWAGINVLSTVGGTIINAPSITFSTGLFVVPCVGKYLRFTSSIAGSYAGTLCLRTIDSSFASFFYPAVPSAIYVSSTLASAATGTTAAAGVLAVGGNAQVGLARTANPLVVAGTDTGSLVRTVLTDNTGRVITANNPLGNATPDQGLLTIQEFRDVMQPIADSLDMLSRSQDNAEKLPVGVSVETPVTVQGTLNTNASIGAADSPSVDAFSRWRVSNPTSLFSVQCQYDANPLLMEGGATGTGVAPAHSANTRMVALSATAGTGTSFFQSYQYSPYQAGKSQLIVATGLLDTAVTGAVVDIGYFDANNGIFFRQNGTGGLQLVRRSSTSGSVVDETVDQGLWNKDRLDGTGTCKLKLDPTKVFILVIDLQFLAMGRVRVGFDIGGRVIYAHEFKHANILTTPYMQTATLPVQMLLTATSTGSTKNCYFKCATVISEGGFATDLSQAFATPEGTVTASSGARTHILSMRPKTTFNSITNRSFLSVVEINILVTGTNPVFWELCLGQAISGTTTFNDINTTYSAFEYNTLGTISGSPAVVLMSGYCPATNQARGTVSSENHTLYPITLDRAGAVRANGTLSLIVSGIGGTSATRATFDFIEIK